jgi:L-rhamnose mutarotase
MAWNFWKKRSTTAEPSKEKEETLSKPKDIPEAVGRYLVGDLGKDPDWVWKLKSVVRRQEEKHRYDVRIFDEIQAGAKQVRVRDYTTLDEHPDLILFEGWYDKKSSRAHMQEKLVPTPKAA